MSYIWLESLRTFCRNQIRWKLYTALICISWEGEREWSYLHKNSREIAWWRASRLFISSFRFFPFARSKKLSRGANSLITIHHHDGGGTRIPFALKAHHNPMLIRKREGIASQMRDFDKHKRTNVHTKKDAQIELITYVSRHFSYVQRKAHYAVHSFWSSKRT